MIWIESQPMSGALKMPWRNCIAVGRAYELLRADVLEQLRVLQRTIGYRYCRFHGIFHDEVGAVVRRPDGKLQFQWHQVDKIYDALLELGLKPFVELNPMPTAMASAEKTIFWWKMNVTPPRQMAEWAELVSAFVQHLVERYGLEEVRQWYFEVWNEPNLPGFWTGTQKEYFELYAASAAAVKGVDAQLRVGGPATSKASWIDEFISHCASDRVPVDFVSTHLYPQDEQVEYPDRVGSPHALGEFFADTIRATAERVRRSAMPNLPIHWTEWNAMSAADAANVDWTGNPTNDSMYGAAFVAKNMVELDNAADTLCWWSATDLFEESGMPHGPFSGTYGLLSIHGIPKPAYHAFALLRKMRGERLSVKVDKAPAGCGAAATRETGICHLLLWHFVPVGNAAPPAWREQVRVPVSENGIHDVVAVRIAQGAGSAWETWKAMGRPQNLTPTTQELLQAHATPAHRTWPATVDAGKNQIVLDLELNAGEVLYLEITPRGPAAAPKGARGEEMKRWNKAMGAKST